MHPQLSHTQFETLLPLAADWAAEQENKILQQGVPLSAAEIKVAKAAGVKEPERVRVLEVDAIPWPANPLLKAACSAIDFFTSAPRGLTFRHGIFVRRDCAKDRQLVIHELVHTAQYERLGGIVPFLKKYLLECFTTGYRNSPLEQEAIKTSRRLCS